MIEYLHIQNLAIVEEVEIELGSGLNVITGETGAGKSILVAGMSLLRGARASAKMLRSGADRALVEAVLRIPEDLARQIDVVGEEDTRQDERETSGKGDGRELIVSRMISRSGRGRVRINGILETAGTLSETLGRVVDMTGQREQQSIAEPANHRNILDRFGVDSRLLQEYREAYEALKQVCTEWDEASTGPEERRLRMELLAHQIAEIEEADLQPGQDTTLEEERRRLASALELRTALEAVVEDLYDRQGAVVEVLGAAERALDRWTDLESSLADKVGRLLDARSLVEDVALELRSLADACELDPERLSEVEGRILYLAGLKRKHRVQSVESLIARGEELAGQLALLEGFESRAKELDRVLADARNRLERAAHRLGDARREAARRLASAVETHLADLDMSGARFRVDLAPLAVRQGDDPRFCFGKRRAGRDGWDRVRFLVAANPGEPDRPVDEIASGGELSRILLALKSATAVSDKVLVYVFDEVDQGVGGRVADVLGKKLSHVARFRQVLCVTHLPQIAAYADVHLRVWKSVEQGRTVSRIRVLEGEERVEELARMSGGADISDQTLAHARDLLLKAESEKAGQSRDVPGGSEESARGKRTDAKVRRGAKKKDDVAPMRRKAKGRRSTDVRETGAQKAVSKEKSAQ